MSERAVAFPCAGASLVGVVHDAPGTAKVGILIVVGGPQYRIGSHRQFLLIARHCARAGIPVMRFDYRGLGDSDGDFAGFEHVDDDIAAAIDAFVAAEPGLERVVLWGLCDGASAILFYAHGDARVAGLVLLNPWVRTATGLARAHLKHYYGARIFSGDVWRRLLRCELHVGRALASLAGTVARVLGRRRPDSRSLPDRMAEGFRRFRGPRLLVLCGADLTAREFEDAAAGPAWNGLLGATNVMIHRLPEADHTFSRAAWRDQVADATVDWVRRLDQDLDRGRVAEERGRAGG